MNQPLIRALLHNRARFFLPIRAAGMLCMAGLFGLVLSACLKLEPSPLKDVAPLLVSMPRRIFVTSTTVMGDMGIAGLGQLHGPGVAGADGWCNADSRKPNGSVYKAMIVDGSARSALPAVDWVFKPNTTYTRLDGTEVFTTTGSGLPPVVLLHSTVGSATSYLTGLHATNQWTVDSTATCTSWTSTGGSQANLGSGNATNYTAFGQAVPMSYCISSYSLLCVEQ